LRANNKPHPNPYTDQDYGTMETMSDKWDKRMQMVEKYDEENNNLNLLRDSVSITSGKDPLDISIR